MEDQVVEDLEPLFDYSRVQPTNFVDLDDDDGSDACALLPPAKRKKIAGDPKSAEKQTNDSAGDVGDAGAGTNRRNNENKDDEDWLPPPPPPPKGSLPVEEVKALQELRMIKQELARSANDIVEELTESAKRDLITSSKNFPESGENKLSKPAPSTKGSKRESERQKIVISIQDKEGVKQFRVYMDDKFERLFKLYADKSKLELDRLSFTFDGEKVGPTATPESFSMEDEDMIEAHVK